MITMLDYAILRRTLIKRKETKIMPDPNLPPDRQDVADIPIDDEDICIEPGCEQPYETCPH